MQAPITDDMSHEGERLAQKTYVEIVTQSLESLPHAAQWLLRAAKESRRLARQQIQDMLTRLAARGDARAWLIAAYRTAGYTCFGLVVFMVMRALAGGVAGM